MSSCRRIKLLLEYDGTEFAGFQLQGKGERTVQGVLERALTKLSGGNVTVHGAGRTDTGVHARGQVVHFDTDWQVPIERLTTAVNGALPLDVAVRSAVEASLEFHARFSAKERTYLYVMWRAQQRSVFWGRYTAHEPRELDLDKMHGAASVLRGKRNFTSFANKSAVSPPSMVRDLREFDIRVAGNGKMLVFRLSADGFLRSMVRNLVGGVRSVGLGEMSVEQLADLVELVDRTRNPCPAAPPEGLCLWRVDYLKEEK